MDYFLSMSVPVDTTDVIVSCVILENYCVYLHTQLTSTAIIINITTLAHKYIPKCVY